MLARGKAAALAAIDKDLDARARMARAQPHMIGSALIAEWCGDGAVDNKSRIGKSDLELRERARPLMAAVRHGQQIGDAQMAFAIGGIGGGRNGRGVRRPHCGS